MKDDMDNEEKKYRKTLREFEKSLMPKKFSDPKTLITKYGSDITNDFTFSRNTYRENLYEDDLNPILDKLRELERTKYGLKDDEYFPLSEMPDDIKELNDQFDKILDEKLIQLFKEHGLNTFADSYKEDKVKFMTRFYEIKDKRKAKIGDSILSIIHNLENESLKCAKIQAFNAASILISSAIEGVLYHACSSNPKFIKELINYNKNKT